MAADLSHHQVADVQVHVEKHPVSAHTHVEDVKDDTLAVVYDEGDGSAARTGFSRMLRRNPSLEFIQDVARENELDLDPVEVKKVERKVYLLIVPSLAMCYLFYYVDKTTLSYAAVSESGGGWLLASC